jgi:adenosylmethionine-8-amino-7-oxononanoate aminotransferase
LQQIPRKAAKLAELLAPLRDLPHVGDVRQRGLIAAVELVQDKSTLQPYPWEQRRGVLACQRALREEVWMRPLGNVIILMPPLVIDDAEMEQLVHAAKVGIVAATQA